MDDDIYMDPERILRYVTECRLRGEEVMITDWEIERLRRMVGEKAKSKPDE